MWLDGFALFVLAGFAVLGGYRGGLATGLRLASLLGAYVTAATLAPRAAPWLAMSKVTALPLAGLMLFVAAYVTYGVGTWLFLRMEDRYRGEGGRSFFDRSMGVLFGFARGGLVVLLVGWLSLWVDALRVAGPLQGIPAIGSSTVSEVTQEVVAAGVDYGLGDDTATRRLTRQMASRPAETLATLQGLIDDPRMVALRDDQSFWSYVSHGDYDAALNRGSFLGIAYDDSLRGRLGEVGVVELEAAADPRQFRDAARAVLEEVGPRLRRIQNDPELQELLADPGVQRALQNGDTLALVQHSGFRRLVERVGKGAE